VADRFSKFAHFIPLSHPRTAMFVAQAFFDNCCEVKCGDKWIGEKLVILIDLSVGIYREIYIEDDKSIH
jgi:hypothetical protein